MIPFFKVLLVGETGVGKSTLINVLTNYFRNGSPDNIKTAIKSKYFKVTEEDLEHPSSEFNVNDQTSSQTSECFSYDFEHPTRPECTYRFIDSPGLGDTNNQDQRNLEFIVEKAVNEKYLHAIVFVVNGKQTRCSEVIKNTINGFNNYLPKSLLENNLFLIVTQTKKLGAIFQIDFFEKEVATPKEIFYMDNLTFSCNPNEWRSDSQSKLEVEQSWDVSQKTIVNFLTAIEKSEFKSTEDFQKIAEFQKDLTAQIRKAIGEISKINDAIIQLLKTRCECEKHENILESSKNYTQEKVFEYLEYIQTPHKNLICINHLESICHENSPNWFVRTCNRINFFSGTCRECGCGWSDHDLQKYKIVRRRETFKEVINELKIKYDREFSNSINLKAEEKIRCSVLEILVKGVEMCYNSIQHDIESLKLISKFNFDGSLRCAFDKLKATAENVLDENLKTKQLKKISEIEEL
ncbi:3525_t:CDS:2, partial [Racocetra persica]